MIELLILKHCRFIIHLKSINLWQQCCKGQTIDVNLKGDMLSMFVVCCDLAIFSLAPSLHDHSYTGEKISPLLYLMHPKRVFIVNWWPVIEFPSFPSSNFPSLLSQRVAHRGGGVHSWQPLVPRCLFCPYLWSNSSGTRVYLSARAEGVSPVQFRDHTRAARTNWLSKQEAVCVPLSLFFISPFFFPRLSAIDRPPSYNLSICTIFMFSSEKMGS